MTVTIVIDGSVKRNRKSSHVIEKRYKQRRKANKTPHKKRLKFHLTSVKYSDREESKYVLFSALFTTVIDFYSSSYISTNI